MQWNEFKEYVEKQLEDQGATGDIEIDYVDVSYPVGDDTIVETDGDVLVIY